MRSATKIFEPMKNVREPFRVAGVNWALLPGTNTLYGLEDVRGYEAMTIEQVASAAGVSKPTIYLRYRSKRELVAAMIDRLVRNLCSSADQHPSWNTWNGQICF